LTVQVKREGEERIAVAGRSIPCDRYTLHPKNTAVSTFFAALQPGAPRP